MKLHKFQVKVILDHLQDENCEFKIKVCMISKNIKKKKKIMSWNVNFQKMLEFVVVENERNKK